MPFSRRFRVGRSWNPGAQALPICALSRPALPSVGGQTKSSSTGGDFKFGGEGACTATYLCLRPPNQREPASAAAAQAKREAAVRLCRKLEWLSRWGEAGASLRGGGGGSGRLASAPDLRLSLHLALLLSESSPHPNSKVGPVRPGPGTA